MKDIWLDASRPPQERAEHLCRRLTLREKVGQLNQRLYGFNCYEKGDEGITLSESFKEEASRWQGLGTLYGLFRADPWSARGFDNGLRGQDALRACALVQEYVMSASRFGIPALISSECPHGHQALDGYLLPVNLAVGATFDPALLEKAAQVCGRQLNSMGVHLALCSVLDMLRDPRWGRSEECYSEDPCLASRFAAAMTRGIQSQGPALVAKHLCAQGETTGGINASSASIGQRELREIHLPPARAAIRAGALGFMAAYNDIDGVPCHASKALLQDILRDEYGFDGIVMADGFALDNLDRLTGSSAMSAALALHAGVDISLWDAAYTSLEAAVAQGLVGEEQIDRAVKRVLTLKFKLGLFEHPYPKSGSVYAPSVSDRPESLQLALESAVLLKNEGSLLPISPDRIKSLALIGPSAVDIYRQLGDYTPPLLPGQGTTLAEALHKLCRKKGVRLVVDSGEDIARAAAAAQACDITVLALGGSSSRFNAVSFDKNGAAAEACAGMDCGEGMDSAALRLPGNQQALFDAIRLAAACVVTVLITGRPYVVPDIADATDALLWCFYPGPQGGQAIASLLFGDASPSGRLPVSIPRHAGQLPVYYNGKAGTIPFSYSGDAAMRKPLYSFGDGFGYAPVSYADFRLLAPVDGASPGPQETALTLCFTARNEGRLAACGVPQLYITRLNGETVPRQRELKAFARVPLEAGRQAEASLSLTGEDLSVWTSDMNFRYSTGRVGIELRDSGALLFHTEITL